MFKGGPTHVGLKCLPHTAAVAIVKRYGDNAMLEAVERAGRIRIERIEKNYIGPNPINPGTAIVWRPTGLHRMLPLRARKCVRLLPMCHPGQV
jgi:hypothetical protein